MSQYEQWNKQYNMQPYVAYPYQQQTTAYFRQQPQQTMLPMEQSYIENILRLNRGKMATVYMTFENNSEWNAKIFKGRVEEAGRDHIVIHDVQTGKYYLLLMVNLDYITFDEPIEYQYPFVGSQQGQSQPNLAQYPPR